MCLKQELDVVLDLQHDLEAIEHVIQTARSAIASITTSTQTNEVFKSLDRSHGWLMGKVEELYRSLNITEQFPDLQGVDLEFIHFLFLA